MRKKVWIFWSLIVAVALFRLWQSFGFSAPASVNCVKEIVVGEGEVADEPERKDSGQVFVIRTQTLEVASTTVFCANDLLIRVKTKLYPRFSFGEKVSFKGKLLRPANFSSGNGRTFDYKNYLAKDDIYFEMKSAEVISLEKQSDYGEANEMSKSLEDHRPLREVIAGLYNLKRKFVLSLSRNLGDPHSALASGLVVGEKAALGKELLNDFRTVGLIHIVVLSGYNITIVADAIRRLFSFLPRLWGISFGGVGIFLFGILVGGGATVVRSCFMAGIALFADVIRRDYSVVRALIFAGLIMIIQNPNILFHDPSFQLSFLATLGLIILAKPIENRLTLITEKFGIRSIVASTFATQIFVSPYILYMMGQISLIGMIVNILVLPFIPLTMLFVFITGTIGIFSVAIAQPFAWISHALLSHELFMVNKFADFPFASVNVSVFSFWWVVGFYVVFAVILIWRNNLTNKSDDYIDTKQKSSNLHHLFDQFSKLPKDVLIDNPSEFVYTGFELTKQVQPLDFNCAPVIFTRRTLKHFAEKGRKGEIMFELIPVIIAEPDFILKGKTNRLMFVKLFNYGKKKEPHAVIVEKTSKGNVLITSFVTDEKYLKNFEILWRTGGSLS
jgi:competence protein ComEC